MTAENNVTSPDYETGYREGESSGYADWIAVLSEYLDIDAEGPAEAVAKIKDRFDTIRMEVIEQCARIAEVYDDPDEGTSWEKPLGVVTEEIAKAIRALNGKVNQE